MSSRTTPGLDQLFAPIRHGEINDVVFSAAATLPVSRIGVNTPSATASSTLSRSVLQGSTTFSHASSSTPSSSSSALPLPPPLALRHDSRLSKSAALGIGVAVGIIGILLFISIALLIYRRYKLRHSPSSRHYRQTKLWKGFVPATPNTARTTFVETKMANIYFAELPTPATPAFMASPPLEENIGDRVSWNRGNRTSWPVSPITPGSPPIEMPI
ncbi:uncharacterized protein K460DRAFT_273742 [Cucurbitaria berberidis CBS 394.84]|uniref:Mid2 domain-containing protein n=1 Tax=Cucurbitaria berberidis CBS 394.84 TaxID=1168544 RepID=A0A9P4GSK0_9PLEO|nr:uncharacterized protein K460DRAFT_273742 [Cucurbitaria berberidis CBS 394.84]KAF1850509.1 hypothetical protein K460DRAFT_273742 [Cucurbitaria berberidis CBS 394.84]